MGYTCTCTCVDAKERNYLPFVWDIKAKEEINLPFVWDVQCKNKRVKVCTICMEYRGNHPVPFSRDGILLFPCLDTRSSLYCKYM